MSKTLLDICVMKEAINVRQCKRARACQLSKNQGIKVGNQMEEKSGKIKYLPRTRAKEGGGGTITTRRMEPQAVSRAVGGWISLMTTVIPEL